MPYNSNNSSKKQRTRTQQPFDLDDQLQKALEYIIKNMEEGRAKGDDWHVYQYFSATDLQRRVRSAAAEIVEQREYGSLGMDGGWYCKVRIRVPRPWHLLGYCRKFLSDCVRKGLLRMDQPSGKRVCSGLRFRPATWDLTVAEKRTELKKEKEKRQGPIVHYLPPGEVVPCPNPDDVHPLVLPKEDDRPLCQRNQPSKKKCGWRWYPKKYLHRTKNKEEVTCKNCLKQLNNAQQNQQPQQEEGEQHGD